jgi:hypothetical protein
MRTSSIVNQFRPRVTAVSVVIVVSVCFGLLLLPIPVSIASISRVHALRGTTQLVPPPAGRSAAPRGTTALPDGWAAPPSPHNHHAGFRVAVGGGVIDPIGMVILTGCAALVAAATLWRRQEDQ